MEKEQRHNQEDENKPRPPEQAGEAKEESEKKPDDTEMWSVLNGLDSKARETVKRESRDFHEAVSDITFGDPADFASEVAGAAAIEMQPFLEAFQQATKNAPDRGKIAKSREVVQQTLDRRGDTGATLDRKG